MNTSENDLRTFPGRERTPGCGFLVPWLGGVGVGASVNWMLTYVGWDAEVGPKVDERKKEQTRDSAALPGYSMPSSPSSPESAPLPESAS